MKHIKKYNENKNDQYLNDSEKDQYEIHKLCQKYGIKNYTINKDGSINVEGNINISDRGLKKIPIKFGKTFGSFNCCNNELITLENSPRWIAGDFACEHNELKTLLGGPEYVAKYYYFGANPMMDLYGFPKRYNHNKLNDNISYHHTPVQQILDMVPSLYVSRFIDLLNEYQVIRGNKIIQPRLAEAILDCNIKFNYYE